VRQCTSFNAAVFDAVTIGLAEVYSAATIADKPEQVIERINGFDRLFQDPDFFASVSGSVNDTAKVSYRIEAMISYLQR
jgi:hypothetical protein